MAMGAELHGKAAGERVCVIVQPCFLAWPGHFDLLSRADEMIYLDNVQYLRRGWYNRNRVLVQSAVQWLTVPVRRAPRDALIQHIEVDNDQDWRRRLLGTIRHAYGKAPHFKTYQPELEEFVNRDWHMLADLAIASTRLIFRWLGRDDFRFRRASEMGVDADDAQDRLIALCKAVGATTYLSGPTAKDYIGDGERFANAGLNLQWMEYGGMPYARSEVSPVPLSTLDLLFRTGAAAPSFIWPQETQP